MSVLFMVINEKAQRLEWAVTAWYSY